MYYVAIITESEIDARANPRMSKSNRPRFRLDERNNGHGFDAVSFLLLLYLSKEYGSILEIVFCFMSTEVVGHQD